MGRRPGLPTGLDPVRFATEVVGEDLSPAQRTLLKAIYGLALTAEEAAIFQACTGRPAPDPPRPFYDVCVIAGRRSGKSSRIVANVAAIEAVLGQHEVGLARGEEAVCHVVGPTRDIADVTVRLIKGKFQAPLLRPLVRDERVNALTLTNGVVIEVETASRLAGRSRGGPLVILEESAFFPTDEATDPDVEILAALVPTMLTYPGARRLKVSTPYAKRGLLHEDWVKHWGRADGATLVWVAPTTLMNPAVDAQRIAADLERDPVRFASEYVTDPARPFREDVSGFLDDATLQAAVDPTLAGQPYDPAAVHVGAMDQAGGGADEPAAAVVCVGRQRVAVVALRVWGSKAPLDTVLDEAAAFFKERGLHEAWADRYGANWPVEGFRTRGILLRTSELTTSQTYIEFGGALRQGKVALPDHPKLLVQLRGLERRTSRDGRDVVDHRPGMRDDVAAAVARAVVGALKGAFAGSAWGPAGPPAPVDESLLQREKSIRMANWQAAAEGRVRRWSRDRGFDL